MATKWKNIEKNETQVMTRPVDIFKGILSWGCSFMLLCGVILGALWLIYFCVNGNFGWLIKTIHDVFTGVERIDPVGRTAGIVIGAVGFVLLLLTLIFSKERRGIDALLARLLYHVWMEAKLFALGFSIYVAAVCYWEIWALVLMILAIYLFIVDVSYNRRFFSHNMIHSILKLVNKAVVEVKGMTTMERRGMARLLASMCVGIGVIVIGAFIFLFSDFFYWWEIGIIAAIVFTIAGLVGVSFWYAIATRNELRDLDDLARQIEEMYNGDLDAVNFVRPTSSIYNTAMQLNMIRTGIQKVVDESVKADRTKVELITNVSHDIKTPLTSIMSYIDLLKKVPDLPPAAADYVNTIDQKARLLTVIVKDVFDISKAATGNISLELQNLDICKLLQQTFVEMEGVVSSTELTWKMDIPETPIMITADGQRLYRVFQNVIRNCAQYSLEGSRVYVSVKSDGARAFVSIRNVSKNELKMTAEELTSRFVRGDENRTTEGSGLGLSIAKSFTEACGGTFDIRTDGDLFTVCISFPVIKEQMPSPPSPEAIENPA